MSNLIALVVLVFTLAFAAPAHASEAPATDATSRAAALQQLTVGDLRQDLAYSAMPISPYQKRINASRGVLVAGAVVAGSGALAFGIGIATFDFYSSGTAPLIAALYGLCAMPVGALMMVGGGIGIAVTKGQARKGVVRISVAPGLVGKSTGLTLAASW